MRKGGKAKTTESRLFVSALPLGTFDLWKQAQNVSMKGCLIFAQSGCKEFAQIGVYCPGIVTAAFVWASLRVSGLLKVNMNARKRREREKRESDRRMGDVT